MTRTAIGAAVLIAVLAAPSGAQTWRTLDVSTARLDSAPTSVQVEYARGTLRAEPAEAAVLYAMHLRYDASRAHPVVAYDSSARSLSIGARARSDARAAGEGRSAGDAVLQLSRNTPLDVSVRLDVASATMNFGGMALRSLSIESVASEVTFGFDAANSVSMSGLELDVSAATMTATGLANANTARLRVGARAGGAELHLDGQWSRDLEVDLDVALGFVTIIVPAGVGVQLEARSILAKVDAGGLQRSGDTYVSTNWSSAARKVRIRANTTLGKLQLIHGAR